MDRIDVHQHLWSEPLVAALSVRRELPFARRENGLTVLYMAGERPYVLDQRGETRASRTSLVERDGLDRALICLSSALGAEALPREEALALIDAHHEGASGLGAPFGVWGSTPLRDGDPDDVDRALRMGCVGVCLPAGALAGVAQLQRMRPVLARLEARSLPLLVHPGPRTAPPRESVSEPLWWPALTDYVSGMHAAWHAFAAAGRARHPRLRVVFAMLAGLAPLHHERLLARGGPAIAPDSLTFYDISSYGHSAIAAMAQLVGPEQLLYGSDRPVVEPHEAGLDWEATAEATRRAFAPHGQAVAR
jgi:hypothetical protein